MVESTLPHHETKGRVTGRLVDASSICVHDEWQQFMPIIPSVVNEHGQHHEACSVETFYHAILLWMIRRIPSRSASQKRTQ